MSPVAAAEPVIAPGIGLVPRRRLLAGPVEAWFPISPGDRPLVAEGQAVVRGAPLAERLRDPRTVMVPGPGSKARERPGDRWTPPGGRGDDGTGVPSGELLFRAGGRWRIAAADTSETLDAPFPGIVREVRDGIGIRLQSPAMGLLGAEVLAGPTAGRLLVATGPDGELRASQMDVGAAGTILVAGARIDAETLTRARAVGVRGIIVAALGIKERHDFLASERRGRAGVHGLAPFGILVLDGAGRRPIASPMLAVLQALEGRTVAIVGTPACLVIDDPEVELPTPAADRVRVRSGPLAGAEGTWLGLAGPRRYPAGVTLESGLVRFGERAPIAVPLGDLERFA
ncbi:MAG TPA: hypothetical protein VF484_09200 [Candidatus Limnocylindrales bacterium]